MELTRNDAWNLLKEFNQEPFLLRHGITVEAVMGYFAKELGEGDRADFWALVGLLHDLDYQQFPDQHCVKSQEIMTERGLDPVLIRAVVSHGYGMTDIAVAPESLLEKVLFAVDELTGLIGAAALMRPSKSVADMELKSLKKKFKDKKFAAGCSRDTITLGAQQLGWELDELLSMTLAAMIACEGDIEAKVAQATA